jgi:flavorubredoxin
MQKYSGNVLFSISAYIVHWVNSILTYCEKSITDKGVLYSRILFVATHKDKVVRYDIKYEG